MQLPRISIVTPSFNQGEFVEETIKSVVQQDYPNLEYVVIDGGSSDNSVDIIKKYQDKIHYWVSEKDEGHGHALNKGFSHTSGEVMAWINSDDMYTPWAFKVVAEIFLKFPHVMWIVGINAFWNTEGAMIKVSRNSKNIFNFLLGDYTWVQQESVFWRRTLWEKAGSFINQDYKFMVDGELWTRFFLHEELHSVECVFAGYRMHSKNRAKCNYSLCLHEMDAAISTMKEKCPKHVLEKYNKIRLLRKIKALDFVCRLRSRFPSLLKEYDYKNIKFRDGAWSERTIPFF